MTALENAPSTNQFAPTDEAKLKKLSSDTTVNADAVIFNSDVSVDPANVSHSENDFTGTPLVLTLNAFPNADGSTGKTATFFGENITYAALTGGTLDAGNIGTAEYEWV